MQTLSSNEIEAANRAEATALLIRSGYRVYRPEADVNGEDLVIRRLDGKLVTVQQKGRLHIDRAKYGGKEKDIWMLFPECPYTADRKRVWYLVPHDTLFDWMKNRHGQATGWSDAWSVRSVTKDQREFLKKFEIQTEAEAP